MGAGRRSGRARPDDELAGSSPASSGVGLRRLLRPRPLPRGERSEVLAQLFFEGREFGPYLVRYFALIFLSVAIASFGLIANSAAVVIGAMLVAPLMTPILGASVATVMVWPARQVRSLMLVLLGSAAAVGLAAAISFLLSAVDPLMSNEIVSRTEPTILDLGVALAAGAAGAYVTVRTKAGAALPGVAVAVALVPPLSVVGILIPHGEFSAAGQALLLFTTNLVAILFAACLVFLATGVVPSNRSRLRSREVRLGVAISAILVAAVAYPLWRQGQVIIDDLRDTRLLQSRVTDALSRRDPDVTLLSTEIDTGADPAVVTLTLAGPEDSRPTTDEIAAAADNMAADLGTEIRLRIHYIDAWIEDGEPAEGRTGPPPSP